MNSKKWAVVVLAVFGTWVLISLLGTFLTSYLGFSTGTDCYVEQHKEFPSPGGEFTLRYQVENCKGSQSTSSLSLRKNTTPDRYIVFYRTPSRFTDAKGIEFNPVSFGIQWNNMTSLDIYYPSGLDIYNNVTGDPDLRKTGTRIETIDGVQVRFMSSKTSP